MHLTSNKLAVSSGTAQCRAREWVSTKLECNSSRRISLFETNIRVVGGLIGAFELSADQMFLDKAVQCVDLMLPIFETSSTGECTADVSLSPVASCMQAVWKTV